MYRATASTALTLLATVAALGLGGCVSFPQTTSSAFPAPRLGDEGVIVAESRLVPGVSEATATSGGTSDCTGPGVGVLVETATAGNRFLFDKTGDPCDNAQVLFDGRQQLNARAADPTIQMTLHDSFGPVPSEDDANTLPPLKALPSMQVTAQIPLNPLDIEPAAGPKPSSLKPTEPDPLVATLSTWQQQDALVRARTDETSAAVDRTLDKLATKARKEAQEEQAAKLSAKLRERERQLQEERRRQDEILARAQENRQLTEAARTAWAQKEAAMQAELAATRKRLAAYQEVNQRISSESAQREASYQEKIQTLNTDLQAASAQADASRRELILKAAAKIAEAEQLAHAAQLEEQDIKLREAARLKSEAETALDRALALKVGQPVKGLEPAPVAAPMALMETPVVIHAKDMSLADLLALVLKQAEPQAGTWKADWQLSGTNGYILKEKWSLTAEAPVSEVLAQINAQVRSNHQFGLTFTQFSQSRLLVVTDKSTQ